VSLRARHPTSNLAVLTESLRIDPAHSWAAGEPRRSQTGALLGGQHRDSYWSAVLPGLMEGGSPLPLEVFVSQHLVQLGRHRECLSKLQADGGEISLLIELSPEANASLTVTSAMARKLADLNIELELQFVSD
jgi:hypothetical protein